MHLSYNKFKKLSVIISCYVFIFGISNFAKLNVKANDLSSPTNTQSLKSLPPIQLTFKEYPSTPSWDPYMQELQHRVFRNWDSPQRFKDRPIIINAIIARDGRLLSQNIIKSSRDTEADKAAMAAVELAEPFSPLPDEYRDRELTVIFTFNNQSLNVTKSLTPPISDSSTNNSKITSSSNTNNYSTPTISSTNNVSTQSVLDWGPYVKNMQHEIRRNWKRPRDNESKRVVVMFRIDKKGGLHSLELVKSSGNEEADKTAIEAVENSSPFSPLPPEFKGDNITIQFIFDYNMHNPNK